MTTQHPLDAFGTRLRDLIERGSPSEDVAFNRLALELFALQFEHNEPFKRFCRHRSVTPGRVSDWREIPAMPTAAFKEFELTSLAPQERTTVFHSSGTMGHRPSRHFHSADSLKVYEASLLAWFKRNVLPERGVHAVSAAPKSSGIPLLALTPCAREAPHSSLVHMFEAVIGAFSAQGSQFLGNVDATGSWILDESGALEAFREFEVQKQPVILLGTAFMFVNLLEWFEERGERVLLAEGSRVMETGGYKGRSRELPKSELHQLITDRLGVPESHIICEYGMSELSSQAYDLPVRGAECEVRSAARVFHFPPWARAQIVSPETNREVAGGETGLIRIFDLANVRSVLAVQTEDLGARRGDGFELLGRAALAETRGCSLMAT
jgi:hypothetical protein